MRFLVTDDKVHKKYISTAATKYQLFYWNFLVVTDILVELFRLILTSFKHFEFKLGLPPIRRNHLQNHSEPPVRAHPENMTLHLTSVGSASPGPATPLTLQAAGGS